MHEDWFRISNEDEVDSPALLVYPDRVEENIRRMISMVGDVNRLRPHMKTHKLPEVIRLQLAQGIKKFKCATIAEAEMTATCGAADVLLAHQPVGPKLPRFFELIKKFPGTKFSAIADNEETLRALATACERENLSVEVLLDVDCGMHRTGVDPDRARELYELLCEGSRRRQDAERVSSKKNPPPDLGGYQRAGLIPGGLHAYDGHIRERDPDKRAAICDAAFSAVRALRDSLVKSGLPVPRLIAGGTPTFPMHARASDVECSPGTCVFWDAGYEMNCPDMKFLSAALVLTRVVSKPGGNRLCLDLGHKSIASENPHPRAVFLNLPDAKAVSHSEEHLVVETDRAGDIKLGDCFYGVPWHVCPTVALHSEAVIVRDGKAGEKWSIVGRQRRLTV